MARRQFFYTSPAAANPATIALVSDSTANQTMLQRLVIICLLSALCLPVLAQPPVLVPQVLNTYPHDSSAFTQGLLWHAGALYESTGLRGRSSLRRVDIETGIPEISLPLDDAYFGEGLERVGDRLIQLTWQSGLAFVYDLHSLELIETINYAGEGWGLCSDGRFLFMSDGSSFLSLRDLDTFELLFRGAVTLDGQLIPPQLLNELECVGEHIYANAWNTDYIFRIDKYTGQITALIDASALLNAAERSALSPGSVLNGIAYNPESQTFYITGKNWGSLFEVVFGES